KSKADALCENCKRRIGANPLRALDCKSPGCKEATVEAPEITGCLCGDCGAHFSEVKAALGRYEIDFTVDPRMVRGLDYYSRTTFEITSNALGAQNAVAAGGRYDSLVKDLGGPETPCFGFAVGIERLALVLGEESFVTPQLTAFIPMGEGTREAGVEIVRALRATGLGVIEDFSGGSLKSCMKRADRLGARFALILGTDELAEESVTLKDMAEGTQERVAWSKLAAEIAGRMAAR
ncbi:MAG: histidine--tRNA ligase, partial [Proteobacteria bacterium]|nr:histidine--tRNA ligase [Pseudomonadota bacterium]